RAGDLAHFADDDLVADYVAFDLAIDLKRALADYLEALADDLEIVADDRQFGRIHAIWRGIESGSERLGLSCGRATRQHENPRECWRRWKALGPAVRIVEL